jgi:peptide-methionine (S)-S-oxide reductase
MAGIVRTRVGYAGGKKENPTYYDLGDHTESIQIDFDPDQLSYDDLLRLFWKDHDPRHRAYNRQYIAAAFPQGDRQLRLLQESRDRLAATLRGEIVTEILPDAEFYRAEGYHQKYYLRNVGEIMRDFEQIYPGEQDFVDSTAAAGVNGYIGGYGSAEQFSRDVESLGLSERSRNRLEKIVTREGSGASCQR